MNYVLGSILMILVGYPAIAAGYFWGAVMSGFTDGFLLYQKHERDCFNRSEENDLL